MRPQATIRPLTPSAEDTHAPPVARRRTLQAVRNQGHTQEAEASPLRDALIRYLESLP